jgi:ABC-type Fe3+-hydroxamate transport system substrate-binding protein
LLDQLNGGCLVGRTRFCNSPSSIRKIPVIGGTKSLDIEAIVRLNPDLVFCVKEENERLQVEAMKEVGLRVVVFDVNTLQDAIGMIQTIGRLLHNEEGALLIADGLNRLVSSDPGFSGSILYLIWQNPWMCAGQHTFIGDVLRSVGFTNLSPGPRYPVFDHLEQIQNLHPDILLLSSEPYPFREKHRQFFHNNLPETRVFCVDGSLFSWYGSRTALVSDYLKSMITKN